MFNFLKSTANKVLAGLTVASIVISAIFYWQYNKQQEKLVQVKVELGKANATLSEQAATLNKKIESDKITDNTQVRVVTETKMIRETTAQIEARVRERISQIRSSVPPQTRDPVVFQKMNDEISRVRLEGLWEMFCVNNPNSPDCSGQLPATGSGVQK